MSCPRLDSEILTKGFAIQAHGTGTKVGDVLELTAISNVFCEGRDPAKPLFVGTSKPNIGHSEAASGSAGLIKTIIAMEKGFIPPNILLDNIKPGLKPLLGSIKVGGRSNAAFLCIPSCR